VSNGCCGVRVLGVSYVAYQPCTSELNNHALDHFLNRFFGNVNSNILMEISLVIEVILGISLALSLALNVCSLLLAKSIENYADKILSESTGEETRRFEDKDWGLEKATFMKLHGEHPGPEGRENVLATQRCNFKEGNLGKVKFQLLPNQRVKYFSLWDQEGKLLEIGKLSLSSCANINGEWYLYEVVRGLM